MQCINCGNILKETAKICIKCGTSVAQGVVDPVVAEQAIAPASLTEVVPISTSPVESESSLVPASPAPDLEKKPSFHDSGVFGNDITSLDERISQQATVISTESQPQNSVVKTQISTSPKVEVSPEFSEPFTNSNNLITSSPGSKKNNLAFIVFGAGSIVIALAVIYSLFNSSINSSKQTNDKPSLTELTNTTALKATEPLPTAPVSESNSSPKSLISKDVLNQILVEAGEGNWANVNAYLSQYESLQFNTVNRIQARQLNQKGLDALKQSQFDEAVRLFNAAINDDLNDAEIKNNLGFTYIKLQKYDLARVAIVDSLLVSPTRGVAWLNAAETFAELNNYKASSQALKAAIYFANNRQKAIETLSDDSKVPSEKLRAVIKSTLPETSNIPSFK